MFTEHKFHEHCFTCGKFPNETNLCLQEAVLFNSNVLTLESCVVSSLLHATNWMFKGGLLHLEQLISLG